MDINAIIRRIEDAESGLKAGRKTGVDLYYELVKLANAVWHPDNVSLYLWLMRARLVVCANLVARKEFEWAHLVLGGVPVDVKLDDLARHYAGLVLLNRSLLGLELGVPRRLIVNEAARAADLLSKSDQNGRWYARACLVVALYDATLPRQEVKSWLRGARAYLKKGQDDDLRKLANFFLRPIRIGAAPASLGLEHLFLYR